MFPPIVRPPFTAAASRAGSAGRLSVSSYLVFLALAVGGLLTSNPLLTAAAVAVLCLVVRLLRRHGETPVLAFAVGVQWAQVTAKLFEADYEGVAVNYIGHTITIVPAIWLGLAGVAVLAIGMHVAIRTLRTPSSAVVDQSVRPLSIERLFAAHVVALIVALIAERLIWVILPLGEILRSLADVRWAFYFILGFVTLRTRRKPIYFLLSTGLEFVFGIGYFSSFRLVLFMAVIIAVASGRRLNFRSSLVIAVAGGATIFLSLAWQAVKTDYRQYLNQGTGQQVVLVSPQDEVKTFTGLVGGVDSKQLTGSVQSLLERLAYVDFFADVLQRVPSQIPHEGGLLLWKAILHVLTPRILFPDKAILSSDSEETMHYTGVTLAGGEQGTSFSLGYMVEQYIDFGRWGMFIPIFVIGLAWGGMYRYCLTRQQPWALRFGFASALMMFQYEFETAEIKLIGGALMRFIVFVLFIRFVMPTLGAWLQSRRRAAQPAQ